MAELEHVGQARTADTLSILTGLWLIVAPAFIGFGSTNLKWSSVITGAVLVLFNLYHELRLEYGWTEGLGLLAGLWAIIAPYTFSGATTGAKWAGVIGGGVAVVMALWSLAATGDYAFMHRHA